MISKDYEAVLSVSKYVEKEVLSCIAQVYKGDVSDITRRLFIPSGTYVIDRYVEALYLNGVEIATLEVSGRSVGMMDAGYRAWTFTQNI